MRARRRLQTAAVAAFVFVYAVLSHYSNVHAGARGLGAGLAAMPLSYLFVLMLWRSLRPSLALAAGVLAGALLYVLWPLLERDFSTVFALQDCAIYGFLAVGFGSSLRAGETPYCTRLADQIRGPLAPPELRYTRQVTLAWAVFFGALTTALWVLFVAAPLKVWSAFANFCALPLVALMFAAEYTVRRRVLPHVESAGAGLVATVRVYLTSSR